MTQYTITKLQDGPRNAVFHISFVADGMGDLTDEVLIDPATSFDPAYPNSPTITIDKLWYDFTGFDARLEFDYLTGDTPVWSMSGFQANYVDFSHFGGLKDRSNPLDGQGKLKITTSDLELGDFGTLVIKVRKD